MTTEEKTSRPANVEELPVFPAKAPTIMGDRDTTSELFATVLGQLANVVDVPADVATAPTPCDDYTVADLQRHVLAWLQFFASALNDPDGETTRVDPEQWTLKTGDVPARIVAEAAAGFERAIREIPDGKLIAMAQARMSKEAVLAMALGEYLTHGWDLSVSTGAGWSPSQAAAEPALEFLRATVAPEYRGPNSGFFGDEIRPEADASTFEQLLCFCGRDPNWTA